ncbi:glutamine-hydrolyzing carbamoyl-phosphate synthase small subunit [Actinacidiphila sp. ITFR-21]|uniref:glutamine-hydrolyzing carbamoyl-phosphate synthase small subunit n=1 Tax=Actinacidiphila sp. ITFR-21 TaxID=3075199 RepID=UPI002889CAAC|nr:glutamine-hydrolyzing carbamoyl-phosphate synthase small subunit [Streptomyces sp. ITFR-21]WNI19869.1 glutamine-hydrolyzing carbamoyl-phosphate synthase small subunit [Streptomyces sp. ITFR-21]
MVPLLAIPAVLALENGRFFPGRIFGATGTSLGEVVFQTGMTGYQETLTDPSYRGQIVVQTATQIGNTGWNDEDGESSAIQVAGYVVRDPSRAVPHWRSVRPLEAELVRQGVVGLAGVDTRSLTRHLREHGVMRAGVFSGDALADPAGMTAAVLNGPAMTGAELASRVSTRRPYVYPAAGPRRFRVAVVDLGLKTGTLRMLAALGVESHVLPDATGADGLLATEPDGVLLSNGPGDPAAMDHVVALTRSVLERRLPLFGICFGNQILGRALGRDTYKMRYSHRGINVPVVDAADGRVAITSHNHGFAVRGEPGERFETPYGPAVVSHHCPNDGTVEGLRCLEVPAFSVQYHPEAAAGPHDASALFSAFVGSLRPGGRR